MYGCQNWQCSAGDSSEPTAKKYKKTTYDKITNDGVQVENLDPAAGLFISFVTFFKLATTARAKTKAQADCDELIRWWEGIRTADRNHPDNIANLVKRTEDCFKAETSAWVEAITDPRVADGLATDQELESELQGTEKNRATDKAIP